MEYCLGDADGSATMWTADPNTDLDGDGALDAVGLDFDGDGLADHMVRDHASEAAFFTDDGSGTWAVAVDRAGQLRWFGLDGVEHFGGQERSDPGMGGSGPVVGVDADGQIDDRLTDTDGDGLADRTLSGDVAYVDTVGDGKADAATEL